MSASTQLALTQHALQGFILHGANEDLLRVHGQSAEDRAARLQIYASAYRLRLIDALAHNYPMLQIHLGSDAFAPLALGYVSAHPSSFVSIRDVGNELASWLELQRTSEPWLAEFARFEWALASAFDSADVAIITPEALSVLTPAQWSTLTFRFSPATQRLMLRTNAPDLYRAAARNEPTAQGHAIATPCDWLIWRRELTAQYRSISAAEAVAIDTLLAGGTFADVCEALLMCDADESVPMHAAAFLKRWLTDELITEFRI